MRGIKEDRRRPRILLPVRIAFASTDVGLFRAWRGR